jgi:hypothetical protein
MSLLALWPSAEAIDQCIVPEAEGAHDAVLLAVHQSAPLSYRLTNGDGTAYPANEDELFTYFTTKAVPTGAHVVPITGASGVGKSHLIRLLAARLKVCPDADRYVVVRIPKSASLRRVVELILELLPAQPYAEVKAAFARALAEVDLGNATIRFQAALDISLRDFAKELREQLKQAPTQQALKERLDHAQRLPLLLSDATTVEHFRSQILPRLVRRAVAGRDVQIDEAGDEFTAEDLNLSGIDLNNAATPVALYYRTALEAKEGRGRKIAADVLNEVRDAATRQLFQLQDALGGMTLQDVILEIRRLLLSQGRELVILVEDFKALTGIQETLLSVLIQEGIRDGEQRHATIRSAIAVTDGYLRERDTIATRAHREWVVESRLQSDDEVLTRTADLVAGYLNAARWGQAALLRNYEERQAAGEYGAPVFATDDEDEETTANLAAFGRTRGVPLFPFTEGAIEYLARAALTQGDTLVFRPRAIILGVLRDLLIHGRRAFEVNAFPPASFKTKPPKDEIAQWLASLSLPEERRARYERLIMIYANNPDHLGDLGRIPSEVFSVYHLPVPPTKLTQPPPAPARRLTAAVSPMPSSATSPAPAPPDPSAAQIANFRQALNTWVQEGTLLEQAHAREIRIQISTALKHRIDWNAERCRAIDIQPSQISIPNARGEAVLAADSIAIAADNRDADGRLRSALIALYRYNLYKPRRDYEEADEDLARIANFLDGLLPAAVQLVRASIQTQVKTYAALLAANSRILGIHERGRSASALASFLFAPSPELEKLPFDAPAVFMEWRTHQEEALGLREKLTQLLLESAGCFQGKGNMADGIDIMRIVEQFSPNDTQESVALNVLPADLRQKIGPMSEQRMQIRLRRVSQEAQLFRAEIHAALGADFDKNAVHEAMKELAEELKNHGNWAASDIGLSFPEFKALCEAFRTTPVKEVLHRLDDLQHSNVASTVAIAQLSFAPLLTARKFLSASDNLVRSAQQVAATLESQLQGVNPGVLASELLTTLETTTAQLTQLTQEAAP